MTLPLEDALRIGEAYAFIMKYAEDNGYHVAGLSRECYIDGIWNKISFKATQFKMIAPEGTIIEFQDKIDY